MIYAFGKDISHTFYPTIDNEPIALPSQAPSIFLFEEKPASVAIAQAGTGATGSEIVYWSESATSPYGRTFTVPAIDDPDPDSTDTYQGYWLAINYIAQTAGTKQTVNQYIEVARIAPTDGVPGTTTTDIKNVYPAITSYITDAQLGEFLTIAEDEMRIEVESKGFQWTRLFMLKRTKLALAFKTISLCMLSQIKEDGDKFHIRYDEFEKKYETILKAVDLPFDSDSDSEPDTTAKAMKTYKVLAK